MVIDSKRFLSNRKLAAAAVKPLMHPTTGRINAALGPSGSTHTGPSTVAPTSKAVNAMVVSAIQSPKRTATSIGPNRDLTLPRNPWCHRRQRGKPSCLAAKSCKVVGERGAGQGAVEIGAGVGVLEKTI